MVMYKVLLALFIVANVLAFLVLIASYVTTVLAKIRKSTLATANIVFPLLPEQLSMVKYCFWSGIVFGGLNWLLCASSVIAAETGSTNALSRAMLIFGLVWAIAIFLGIVSEVVLKCIKSSGSNSYTIVAGIKSSILFSIVCFVVSFLIA